MSLSNKKYIGIFVYKFIKYLKKIKIKPKKIWYKYIKFKIE